MILLAVPVACASLAGLAVAGAAQGPSPVTATPALAVAVDYRSPVDPLRVLRPFRPPVTRYGLGHLGVDLVAAQGTRVDAAGAGVVTFAGRVAGRPLVVVRHADGIRTEYEPVQPGVAAGETVTGGQVLGVVHGRHRGCAQSCLHWGARRGAIYLDPLSLLRRLGPVRLLPWTVR